jgi:hypothetical protein
MAHIKMTIEEWMQSQEDSDVEKSERELITPVAPNTHLLIGHWDLQIVPFPFTGAKPIDRQGDPSFRNFNIRLLEYIARHHTSESVRFEQEIKVRG